jgi:hypothetical protein
VWVRDQVDLGLFARLGLVDIALTPKAALPAWDVLFARPYEP